MEITAKELASKLNISAAAVSMALNNKSGVSKKTRKLVLEEAQKYGYDLEKNNPEKNAIGSVYFIVYKKHGTIVGDTPFFSQLTEGISVECKNQNFKLNIAYIYENDQNLNKYIDDIKLSNCAGIVVLGTEMKQSDLDIFLKLNKPIVLLDSYFENTDCDSVLINNIQGAFLATSYLITKTNTEPGYLKSSYRISNFYERATGFYNAVRALDISTSKCIVHELTPSIEGAYADMKAVIKAGNPLAKAYFADNDLIAVGAIKALKEAGYKIPVDISIVGFDNVPVCDIIDPPLSTVNVPKQYMGQIAVRRLIERIKEPNIPKVKIEISTKLELRNSIKN